MLNYRHFLILLPLLAFGGNGIASTSLCDLKPSVKKQQLDNYTEKKEIISQNVLMSVFSAIAYENNDLGLYKLPDGWRRSDSKKDKKTGLFIAVFENEQEKHLVIAYRGTQATSWRDWYHNINPLGRSQSKPAIAITQKLIEDHPNWSVTLTGHSLGGGLAIETSHKIKGVEAVAFNPSPRIGLERSGYSNSRIVFREKHEPLAIFRRNPSWRKDWDLKYEVLVDFTPGFFVTHISTQHGIDSMAMNLLTLSSAWSEEASLLHQLICNNQSNALTDK